MKLSTVLHDRVSVVFAVQTILLVVFLRFLFNLYHA